MFVGNIDHVYRLLERLGEGVNGEVYKVEGPEGIVGLKLLKKEVPGLTPQERISLFKFEFSLLKGLSHPHIIEIRDFGYDDNLDRFYYTQEWVQGKTVEELGASLTLPQIQKLFLQALQGLAYLHRQSVLHGDLSSKNLLVIGADTEDPTLKIIDFGVSRRLPTGGTPDSMAPEKILKEPISAQSDLYSLGVVFYSLFTRGNPFLRGSLPATLQAHLKFIPPAATVLRPELDPVWSRLLDWMLQKKPRNRVDSAETCLEFLESHNLRKGLPTGHRRLQKSWIDRRGILKQALRFLDEVAEQKKPRALLLLGPKHLGQAELMTELKYEAELRGIRIAQNGGPRGTGPHLRLDFWEHWKKPGHESLVLAAPAAKKAELMRQLRTFSPRAIVLGPLPFPAMKRCLQGLMGQQRIPAPFLKTLWSITKGFPEPLYEVLQRLAQDPLLVDVSGRWQTAIFSEMPGILEDRLFGEGLPHLPAHPPWRMDPKMAWLISFNQARAWAREEKFDAALKQLRQLEKDLPRVFSKEAGSKLGNRYFALLMKAFGWIYSKQGRLSKAREAFSAGLARLQENSDEDQIQGIRLRNYLAFLDMQEGRLQEAIQTFLSSDERAASLGPQGRKLITNNELGAAYLEAGQYDKAIERLEEDWRFFAELRNLSQMMKISYSLGRAYAKTENFREAKRAYEQTADLARGERNWEFLYRALNGLGNVAKSQRRLGEALDYYRRSLILVEYRGDFLSAATVSQNRGAILSEMGRLNEALRDLEFAKQLAHKAPASVYRRCLLARICQELGSVRQKQGDYEQAMTYFSEARNRSEEEPMLKDFRFYPLISLAELALLKGKAEAFRNYHAEAVHWADTLEKKQKLQELEARKAAHAKFATDLVLATASDLDFDREEALGNILLVNRALLTEDNPEVLLKRILQCAANLSDAETVFLLECGDEGHWRLLEFLQGEGGQVELEFAKRMADKARTMGRTLKANDAGREEPFRRDPAVQGLALHAFACIPVEIPDRVSLALYLSHRFKAGLFTENKLRLLEAVADQAALALKTARRGFLGGSPSLSKETPTRFLK